MSVQSVAALSELADAALPRLTDLLPAGHVSFYGVGAGAVLFDSSVQRLYLMNRSAGFIWCGLAEGMTPDEIVAELARRTRREVSKIASYVDDALRGWREAGLLAPAFDQPPAQVSGAVARAAGKAELVQLQSASFDGPIRFCRMLDRDFAIRMDSPDLEPLAIPLVSAHFISEPADPVGILDLRRMDENLVAICRDRQIMQVVDAQSLAPAVLASLVRLALECSATYPALHAGAVRGPEQVVLFAGPSGFGKSTLLCGLMAEGYRVLCDDTVMLDLCTMGVRRVTPYLCAKSGAWNVLGALMPELADTQIYTRPDGAVVRYLLANGATIQGEVDPGPARVIVFPRFRSGASTRLTRIGGCLSLRAFLPSLDPIGHSMTGDDVERLIRWLAQTECLILEYGSLGEAIDRLRPILT